MQAAILAFRGIGFAIDRRSFRHGSNFAARKIEPLPGPLSDASIRNGTASPSSGRGNPMDDDIARASRAKKGSPFLSTEQAAFYLGLSPRKLQAMRASGEGPRFRRHSRFVRYHIDELEDWSQGLTRSGDSNG
jgi:hypothetical protein